MRRAAACAFLAAALSGCTNDTKPQGAGSPGPSLDAPSAEERAAAAKKAEEKYGS